MTQKELNQINAWVKRNDRKFDSGREFWEAFFKYLKSIVNKK